MEPVLIIIALFMILILGLLTINLKLKMDVLTLTYIITAIAFGSMILLMLTYNTHPECDSMLNHNNVSLQIIQDKCYKYMSLY
jgi:ABC-type multidrug transport system permease subunit